MFIISIFVGITCIVVTLYFIGRSDRLKGILLDCSDVSIDPLRVYTDQKAFEFQLNKKYGSDDYSMELSDSMKCYCKE